MFKKKYIYILVTFLLLIPFNFVKASDLTEYFSINDVKFCEDATCAVTYNETNGIITQQRFLSKIKWELHSSSSIQEGDYVEIPFANNIVEGQNIYGGANFSWADIYDNNNNKIGKWNVSGIGENRKIRVEFSDSAIGKFDLNGTFITGKNIYIGYIYSDKTFAFNVGDNISNLKFTTYLLGETNNESGISNSNSSNNQGSIRVISPKITAKQIYDNNMYSSFTADAILNNLYYELTIPAELNATINRNKLFFNAGVVLPTSLEEPKASGLAYFLDANPDTAPHFTKIIQDSGESYSHFKNRLQKFQYGIYEDNYNNKTIVVNYGEQPSQELTYQSIINSLDNSVSEPGDYWHKFYPITVDNSDNNNVQGIINQKLGSKNSIGGKIVSWGLYFTLNFPTVKVETTKSITGVWSWKNGNNEIKTEEKSVDIKLVAPSSLAKVSGASQLLLRDIDTKNEIQNAGIKLEKKNGNDFEEVGSAITDSSGMVIFRNLESGTYRYSYIPNSLQAYNNDSFKTYSDVDLNNIIVEFEFDEDEGNVVYATLEKKKYTVTYLPGEHGDFTDVVYRDLPYGSATPNYDALGNDGWIFKEWMPDKEYFVMEDKTYTASWYKNVKVTTRYLEDGSNEVLSSENTDIAENGTEYVTTKKDIDNYEYVRVVGNVSGTRGEEDIVVTYYYKKKESALKVNYLDCTTREIIAPATNTTIYYGDNYDADTYEANVTIPQNYNRNAANKSDNYKGIVDIDSINVEYCYNKKDSNLNSEIIKSGTNKITKSKDKVSYKIEYNSTFTDYIGDANITVVDNLPYKIDVSKSNLDGGVYDDENKTITWNINTSINSYDNSSYNVTKNIELSYLDLDVTANVITNSVSGNTSITNKDTEIETNYNTYIDIKGTINVKYVEIGTNNDLIDPITTTDKVGKTYIPEGKNIEGYKLIDSPKKDKYEYEEENQDLEFIYERIKYKIVTKVLTEGGTITGDEEVFYGDDSTSDKIKIKAEEGYYISDISINGEKINIPENQNELVMPNFTKMLEDKYIEVSFKKNSNIVDVPNTLKKSILKSIGIIITLGTIYAIIYILYKRKIIFNK